MQKSLQTMFLSFEVFFIIFRTQPQFMDIGLYLMSCLTDGKNDMGSDSYGNTGT